MGDVLGDVLEVDVLEVDVFVGVSVGGGDLLVDLDGAAIFSGGLVGEDGLPYLLVCLLEVGDHIQVLEDDDHDHVQALEDGDQVAEPLR